MPVTPTYPGVYIEEVPSEVRTITGVSTSVTAFLGFLRRGPMNQAVQIFNMGDFNREFGGLDAESEVSYALQQFFLNGGAEAWVVRTATGAKKATLKILDNGGAASLEIEAINEGVWGNHLRVSIDYNPSAPSLFNMTVSEYAGSGENPRTVRSEVFRNLSMDPKDASWAKAVVNDRNSGSKLIQIEKTHANAPAQNGTVSGDLSSFSAVALTASSPAVDVTIGTEGSYTAKFKEKPATLEKARSALESAIRSSKPDNPAFASAEVALFQNRLRILAGPTSASSRIAFGSAGSDPTAEELALDTASALSFDGAVSGNLSSSLALSAGKPAVSVTIGNEGPHLAEFAMPKPTSLTDVRSRLENAIRGAGKGQTFKAARVAVYSQPGDHRLIVIPGISGVKVSFAATPTDNTTVSQLKLNTASVMSAEGLVSGDIPSPPTLSAVVPALKVTIGNEGPHTATLSPKPTSLNDARTRLEEAIRSADKKKNQAFTGARVALYSQAGEHRLVVIPGHTGNTVVFTEAPQDAKTVKALKLDTASGAVANVQEYRLGAGAAMPNTAQGSGASGYDGLPPDGTALIGDLNSKTGIYALEDVDLFNILCIPRTAMVSGNDPKPLSASEAQQVIAVANHYCEKKRAFFILDTPNNVDDVQEIKSWLKKSDSLRHANAAVYFPRIRIADPLHKFRPRSIGACGTIAGLYARTDSARGVWKAPAGTEAVLRGVQSLDYKLTDQENGTLNPLGINCLRNFPIYGNVSWGSRTLVGSDQQASEWKYIPVRRLTLFLEESLYRGTQWVVFEPNDEPLWAQIRLNIGAFMHSLFRQGAFQGSTPRDAYLVKCDKETTTQDDINRGIVNILVGFAPLKPAEFVIIKIRQIAGQIET